ncbi:TylF/MycF family methyltransferase [Alphaproteobacteria bacterium]|nr:TylF/MycF family methyltransferase [Alphaproteobacteria bacterium]
MKKDNFLESREEFAKNLGAPELYDFIDQFSLYAGIHTIGNKLWTYDLYKTTVGIPGDIYEFGCWKGANLMFLAKLNKLFEPSSPKQIYGFDNFSGLPEASSSDGTFAQSQAGKYLGNEQQLRNAIELFELEAKVSLIVGDALKTIPKFKSDRKEAICSLAYIDFDLYEPCAAALTFLEETLSVGGLIIFDEAGTKEWPGETLAMKEYLKNTKHNFEMLSNPFSRQPTIAMRRVL